MQPLTEKQAEENYICVPIFYTHCVKGVRIRSYSGPYFPVFGLNTERYVSFRIQSEFGEIRTRISPNTDTFYAVTMLKQKTGLEANKTWNKLTVIALTNANFQYARPFSEATEISFKFHLLYQCWSCWICILLYLDSIRKKYCILHIVFISSVASSNKYSKVNLISFFIFLSKHKALYKQNLLEYTFHKKI